MAEPAPHSPWETDLPADVAAQIASHLPCRWDRVEMAAVCRAWRDLLQAAPAMRPPSPDVPWLVVSRAGSTRAHCILSSYRAHRPYIGLFHGARYFGSYDGAWLFLAFGQTQNHALFNLRDGDDIRVLPEFVRNDNGDINLMVILAATLSASPDDPTCVVGACILIRDPGIPGPRRFAYWRMGALTATCIIPEPQPGLPAPAELEPEDVVYHAFAFHVLTRGEHVVVFQSVLGEDGREQMVFQLNLFDQPGARDYGNLAVVRARYLVVSGLELLMVVRLSHPGELLTSSFRVFLMIPPQDVGGEYPWSWGELNNLDDRMLFVGRGCSRSYQVANYPGFRAGIYFCDDHSFYDEEMVFLGDNDRQYSLMDNGKWLEGPPPVVQRWPLENPSNHSPPVWLLP